MESIQKKQIHLKKWEEHFFAPTPLYKRKLGNYMLIRFKKLSVRSRFELGRSDTEASKEAAQDNAAMVFPGDNW